MPTETELRRSRLKSEAYLVASKYNVDVNFDRSDATWFHIARMPIPSGWNRSTADILIDIPHGSPCYPQVMPEWFWTNRDLCTSDGHSIGHFFKLGQHRVDQTHWDKGYGHFCIHLHAWRPVVGSNFERGDTLLSYLKVIMQVFHEREKLVS